MSTPISLIHMPNLVKEHIFKFLQFPTILVLRKVCHDLRKFIDDTKPASHLTEIEVKVNPDFIELCLMSRAQNHILIFYEKRSEGCLVTRYHENGVIERLDNEDSVTVFSKDFDIILRHQKTELEEFTIDIDMNFLDSTFKERVLERITKSLKYMNHPLQVESLHMMMSNHNEILNILPCIDTKPLEYINIYQSSLADNFVLNLDEIGYLEQWKQAKELRITGFKILDLCENVKHFSTIVLDSRKVSFDELILLKEMFVSSSTLTTMEINIDGPYSALVGPRLVERFGEPLVDTDEDRNWFFRIPDSIQYFRITLSEYDDFPEWRVDMYLINFNRIEQSAVPQNAIILN